MSERNYYVLCDDNCRFESMTKEQIYTAIAEATGETPVHIDDAFITKIKEQNRNTPLKFWIGTQAEYNALLEIDNNVFYIFSDTDELSEIEQLARDTATEVCEPALEQLNKKGVVIYDGADITSQSETELTGFEDYEIVKVYGNGIKGVLCSVTKTTDTTYRIHGMTSGALSGASGLDVIVVSLGITNGVVVSSGCAESTLNGSTWTTPVERYINKIVGIY